MVNYICMQNVKVMVGIFYNMQMKKLLGLMSVPTTSGIGSELSIVE